MKYKSKALIIDDNEEILEVLSYFFEVNDVEYAIAKNGTEALLKIRESIKNTKDEFDIVLLDLAMPHLSGFQVIDDLKKEDLQGMKTLVVLTALDLNPEQVQFLMSRGVKSIVRKPISIDDLEATLGKYF